MEHLLGASENSRVSPMQVLCAEAAAEIERLTAENERIRTDRLDCQIVMDSQEMENDRLRQSKGNKMKLFVWREPYRVSYGQSMLFIVADTVEHAKALAKTGKVFRFGLDFSDEKRFPGYQQIRNTELGAPDHILDTPCAEWHEFSE